MSDWQPPARGALDDTPWPETLVARAGRRTERDHELHGYEVIGDVAQHYSHSDLTYLAIVGELPDERASSIFHVALCSLSVTPVNEAPCHVGILSRICGGALASSYGASMIALADQAAAFATRNEAVLAQLVPGVPITSATPEPERVRPLEVALAARGVAIAALQQPLSFEAAQVCLLFEAGFRTSEQLQAAVVIARVTGITAELLVTGPQHLRDYPVKLPPFHYVEDQP
jgi:hypothetical protein